jgi:hypothetical protein
MSEHRYSEKIIAEVLGLARDTVRVARLTILKEGDHWAKAHNEVALTAPAVPLLLKTLGVKIPKKRASIPGGITIHCLLQQADLEAHRNPTPPKKTAGGPAVLYKPPPQILIVDQLTRNHQILLARFKDEQLAPKGAKYLGQPRGLVRVRVRNTEKFVIGMEMNARHVQADLWELVGRGPRFRGRW